MRAKLYHEISRSVRADVSKPVQFIGSFEDDSACCHYVRPIALIRGERAFLNEHQFLVRMLMRKVRGFAGVERGDVALEVFKCRCGCIENLAAFAGPGLFHFHISPVEDGGMHHRFCISLSEGDEGCRSKNGNGSNDEISTGNHAGISAPI